VQQTVNSTITPTSLLGPLAQQCLLQAPSAILVSQQHLSTGRPQAVPVGYKFSQLTTWHTFRICILRHQSMLNLLEAIPSQHLNDSLEIPDHGFLHQQSARIMVIRGSSCSALQM